MRIKMCEKRDSRERPFRSVKVASVCYEQGLQNATNVNTITYLLIAIRYFNVALREPSAVLHLGDHGGFVIYRGAFMRAITLI